MKIIDDTHQDYGKFKLTESDLTENPIDLFMQWYEFAKQQNIPDYNAFVLSTATPDGIPSSRVLLLKGLDDQGLIFFTNYESQKARELSANPNAAMLFFWKEFERQVRVVGKVDKISPAESYEYFKTRPITSRAGAWASKQSQPLPSRFRLIRDVAKILLQHPIDIPLPPHWGGYRLSPIEYEFWQGRENRLHDRFKYRLEDGIWKVCRLYP